MAFNINNIISAINGKGGLLRSAHYEVRITTPKVMQGIANDLHLFCTDATLPGYSFQLTPIRPAGYGVAENRPSEGVLGELSLTFMIDAKADTLNFFHQWLYRIQNINASGIMSGSFQNAKVYEFHYPDNYQTVLEIICYNDKGGKVLQYKVGDAYPKSINGINMTWKDGDEYMKFSVDFDYGYWVTDHLEATKEDTSAGDHNQSVSGKDHNVSTGTSKSH